MNAFCYNFFQVMRVHNLSKSVKICQSYWQSLLPRFIMLHSDKMCCKLMSVADSDHSNCCEVSRIWDKYMKDWLSVQLKDVLTRTINAWVNLFDESNKDDLPQLCMELVNENGQMAFFPSYEHLEELILFVVQQIADTLQSVCLPWWSLFATHTEDINRN